MWNDQLYLESLSIYTILLYTENAHHKSVLMINQDMICHQDMLCKHNVYFSAPLKMHKQIYSTNSKQSSMSSYLNLLSSPLLKIHITRQLLSQSKTEKDQNLRHKQGWKKSVCWSKICSCWSFVLTSTLVVTIHLMKTIKALYIYFLQLSCPNGISPMGISGCLPRGKPAATESPFPTYGGCWVF